jgi:two-component system CheB/CheR fusion protein
LVGGAFPIVGIGASAGGLAAFEAFFGGMPDDVDPGMAFVLVQHLAPDHKSLLTELIQRSTRMLVYEVEDGMVVRPNCVYIIPPGRDMACVNGTLQLLEPALPRGQRLPIDFFLQSLSEDQRGSAIAIILSGMGSDGTMGIRAIKHEGGMVMVQPPGTTEFDAMPRSALSTGLVDYELPPEEMAVQLLAYAARAFGANAGDGGVSDVRVERMLEKIFMLLRVQTGHDFSLYKPSTIRRRIERRMAVHQIDALGAYVRFLQQTPAEVELLFRDLLIGVTSFFRDPDVFRLLAEEIIPGLFVDRPADSAIRFWIAGCSTGEEAYSLAILLAERMETMRQRFTVQIFATDIDAAAIATARAGVYPPSIAADVTPERLSRFFVAQSDGSGYRVQKGIRDMLIFSEQDVIKDPPISKLDLISCRNVLIYMGAELQKKLIPLFHYALKPGGTLLLGTSEGIGEFDALFAAVDRKAKLYRRLAEPIGAPRTIRAALLPTLSVIDTGSGPVRASPMSFMKRSLREITEHALLQHVVAAGALVNADGDILYLHGRSGQFLELAPGESGINNVVKMAREGLGPELASALREVVRTRATALRAGLRVRTNGHFSAVDLAVLPVLVGLVPSSEVPLYLVVLSEARDAVAVGATLPPSDATPADPPRAVGDATPLPQEAEERVAVLMRELRAKEEYLISANEELQSSTEELKSSNEEMQSVNEELQSTNEELETAKEEMQSINEELATVNAELQNKVGDLSRANDDMNNLLAGTGIGTVFVDHQLRILRFTPAARSIINLIPSDVGRPVAHIVSNFVGYNGLVASVQTVLDTLVTVEMELQTTDGNWYLMRILPYRTLKNVIEGAVISFLDISETVRIRESLREANALTRLAVVLRDASDAVTVHDMTGRIVAWNPGAERMYGWTEAEAVGMNMIDRVPEAQRATALAEVTRLSLAGTMQPYVTQRLQKSGDALDVTITSTALLNEAGQMYAVATTERVLRAAP